MNVDQNKKMRMEAGIAQKSECIRVIVRVRPLNSKEKQAGYEEVALVNSKNNSITIIHPSGDRNQDKTFSFDATFDGSCNQQEVFEQTGAPIVDNVFEGYNGTIFCYGQTGSGKTHTMEGRSEPATDKGIMPRAFKQVFDTIGIDDTGEKKYLVHASYLELYNEEVRDLLSKDPNQKLKIHESPDSGVYVEGLTSPVVKNIAEIDTWMQKGKTNRSTASTLMNATSSRSHSIFTIIVEQSEKGPDGSEHIKVGKLNLVDLAGSERIAKTGAEGQTRLEGIKINLSLSTLGSVIEALVDGKSKHIPYRDSKLTRLLQDSLGGNTKTCMIANCGPAGYNYDETISTLRYADRAKKIKNKPSINEDPKDAMLREFQEEIIRLRKQLESEGGGVGGAGIDGGIVDSDGNVISEEKVIEKVVVKEVGVSEEELKKIEEKARRENEMKLKEIEEKLKEAEMNKKNAKENVRKQALEDIQRLIAEKERTEKERSELEEKVKLESKQRKKEKKSKDELERRLKEINAQLIESGQVMDAAAKQEKELRRVRAEIEAKRKEQELVAAQLAEEAERKLLLQDKFSSLHEECEVKSKKIEKVQNKIDEVNNEMEDLEAEWNREKEDFLDIIRDLNRQMQLKELIIKNFIPPDEVENIQKRAKWDDGQDDYILPKMKYKQPMCDSGCRRCESRFTKDRKVYDASPRYHSENIVNLDLDLGERTTEDLNVGSNCQAPFILERGTKDDHYYNYPYNVSSHDNDNGYEESKRREKKHHKHHKGK